MQKTLTALLLAAAASAAVAAPSEGFYFGGSLGLSNFTGANLQPEYAANATDEQKAEFDKTHDFAKLQDKRGLSFGLNAGYRFNEYLAAELGFQHSAGNVYTKTPAQLKAADSTYGIATSADPSTKVADLKDEQYAKSEAVTNSQNAVELLAKVGTDFYGFYPYLKGGVAYELNKYSADFFDTRRADTDNAKNTEALKADFKHNKFAPVLAAGVEYYFTPSFSFGVEVKNHFGSANQQYTDVAKLNDASKPEVGVNGLSTAAVTTGDTAATVEKTGYAGTDDASVKSVAPAAKAYVGGKDATGYKPSTLYVQATANFLFGQELPVVVAAPEAPAVEVEKFELKSDVLFAFNSAKLTAKAAQELAPVVEKYKTAKDVRLEVVGHADRIGNPDYNQKLSQRRAVAVADRLVTSGVNQADITARGVGTAEPKTDGCYNVTSKSALRACLAPDRRVDVYLQGSVAK